MSNIKDKLKKFFKGEKAQPQLSELLQLSQSFDEQNEQDAVFDTKEIMGVCISCKRNTKYLFNKSLNWRIPYEKDIAEEYCKQHELKYPSNKCIVEWCGDCGYIIKYDINDINKT